MKLIFGLGNPGKEYKNTRHNVGFLVIDNYLGDVSWKKKFNGLYYEKNINGEKIIFVKPETYMNLSGDCVVEFVNYYKVSVNDILIIHDDLDLSLFSYKLKFKSSSGGHNGMKSIINRLGTESIPRLKIGISKDKNVDVKDYVLGSFSNKDMVEFNNLCNTTRDIINLFIEKDIDKCMMKFN